MRKKLPLDPFDPETPRNPDYQLGQLAWAIFVIGIIGGTILISSSNFDGIWGWLTAITGLIIITGAAYIARKIIESI